MNDIKVGDEVVRIDHPNGPEKGIVTAVSGTCFSIGGSIYQKKNFAKIPYDPIKESFKQLLLDVDDMKKCIGLFGQKVQSTPCPHPEWLGIWKSIALVYKIEWNGLQYVVKDRDSANICIRDADWEGPESYWNQIESAPIEAKAHKPLPRPKPVCRIKTPVDPYDLG